ncbi:MAG: glutathione S-transferase N-terminal domain-containing protein [Alphaproteobacteria bacterium]|nr:glutathione S-transferase N-terminal domain-containing protein [Alphaproteobacteria bacterium]
MILVGQYDSPYVRRVAVSLLVLGLPFTRDTRSVFGDFDAMRRINPLGRIPSLVLDDGEVLIDSAAILDHIDEQVGPARALVPRSGKPRRETLRRIALATGAIDKFGALAYERIVRPGAFRWPEWQARCETQAAGAVEALARESWPDDAPLDQARITTVCLLDYVATALPGLLPAGRHPALDALAAGCATIPAFRDTRPGDYAVPRNT